MQRKNTGREHLRFGGVLKALSGGIKFLDKKVHGMDDWQVGRRAAKVSITTAAYVYVIDSTHTA